jgi:UDP-3-O-[3-hydroxymyristoyl] glucosamine N-acyltransferase
MRKTLKEIARIVGGEVIGDGEVVITGVSGIKEACEGDITFLANPKYYSFLDKTKASAVVTSIEVTAASKPIIRTENPSLAFARIISVMSPAGLVHPKGIHPTVIIGKNTKLGSDVAIGPYVVLDDGASVGDRTIIYSGCFIGNSTRIGSDCLIYPNVSIRERVEIGSRVIIHSGTVVGSDGFGYITIKGRHHKVPQVGSVEIGDDVEIGANVTIDRARFAKTIIGNGTKIDNLVQVAHNVIIGEDSMIVAQVGIAGSAIIGKGVVIGGQAGVAGHISVGDGATVAGQAGATKSVPANTVVSGFPARKHEAVLKVNACMQRLPKLYDEVAALKKKIEKLENKLKEK